MQATGLTWWPDRALLRARGVNHFEKYLRIRQSAVRFQQVHDNLKAAATLHADAVFAHIDGGTFFTILLL